MSAAKGPEGTAPGPSGPFVHRVDLAADAADTTVHVAWTGVAAGSLAFHVLGAQDDAAREDVAAARRAIEQLLPQDFDVKVLVLPDGKDPDDFIRENGTEAYNEARGKAEPTT